MKQEIFTLFKNLNLSMKEHELMDYINFCFERLGEIPNGRTEKHHILPRCLFPEFQNEKSILLELSYADHIQAHNLLRLAFPTHRGLNFAYYMMTCANGAPDLELAAENRAFLREHNPSKRSEVREKISAAKKGVSRPDMAGKKYFGADESTLQKIKLESSKVHKGTVPVVDSEGNTFKVSTDDPRYLSGELKYHGGMKKGETPRLEIGDAKKKFKNTLKKRAEKFSKMSSEQIIEHCLEMQNSGKSLISSRNPSNLGTNYSRLFNYAGLDWRKFLVIKNGKVQRLSKADKSTKRLW